MGDSIANYTYPTDDPFTFIGKVLNGQADELCRVTSHWRPKEQVPDIALVNLIRNS